MAPLGRQTEEGSRGRLTEAIREEDRLIVQSTATLTCIETLQGTLPLVVQQFGATSVRLFFEETLEPNGLAKCHPAADDAHGDNQRRTEPEKWLGKGNLQAQVDEDDRQGQSGSREGCQNNAANASPVLGVSLLDGVFVLKDVPVKEGGIELASSKDRGPLLA